MGLMVEAANDFHLFSDETQADLYSAYTIAEFALLSYIISNFIISGFKRRMVRYVTPVLVVLFIVIECTIADKSPAYEYLSLLIANAIITIYTLVGISFEEKKLLKQFGTEYDEYRRSVPKIIPFIKRSAK